MARSSSAIRKQAVPVSSPVRRHVGRCAGYLWIPATQQNLTKGFNNGRMTVKFPVWIYKLQIGQMPSPIDHS
jgi:hypothetical protein